MEHSKEVHLQQPEQSDLRANNLFSGSIKHAWNQHSASLAKGEVTAINAALNWWARREGVMLENRTVTDLAAWLRPHLGLTEQAPLQRSRHLSCLVRFYDLCVSSAIGGEEPRASRGRRRGCSLFRRIPSRIRCSTRAVMKQELESLRIEFEREHGERWRNEWRALQRYWLWAQERGLAPHAVDWPQLADRRATHYRLKPAEAPKSLVHDITVCLEHLQAKPVLRARQFFDPQVSSLEKSRLLLYRYLGFCKRILNLQLENYSLDALLQWPNVEAYVKFISERRSKRLGPFIRSRHYGKTEAFTVVSLIAISRHGLRNEELAHQLIANYNRALKYSVSYREALKPHPEHDSLFRVVIELLNQAEAVPMRHLHRRAIIVRDAAVFAVLGCYAFRRGILSQLVVEDHLQPLDEPAPCLKVRGDSFLLVVPREFTKPRIRDSRLIVPPEVQKVLALYLDKYRPLLFNECKARHLFLTAAGKPITGAGLYAMVCARYLQITGQPFNPHLARKTLITEWLDSSDWDTLTASRVMDCSLPAMEQSYYRGEAKASVQKLNALAKNSQRRLK